MQLVFYYTQSGDPRRTRCSWLLKVMGPRGAAGWVVPRGTAHPAPTPPRPHGEPCTLPLAAAEVLDLETSTSRNTRQQDKYLPMHCLTACMGVAPGATSSRRASRQARACLVPCPRAGRGQLRLGQLPCLVPALSGRGQHCLQHSRVLPAAPCMLPCLVPAFGRQRAAC